MAGLICYCLSIGAALIVSFLRALPNETVFGIEIPGLKRERRGANGMTAVCIGCAMTGAAVIKGLTAADRIFLGSVFLLTAAATGSLCSRFFVNIRICRYYRKAAQIVVPQMEKKELFQRIQSEVEASNLRIRKIWADGIEGILDFEKVGLEDLSAAERYCMAAYLGGKIDWQKNRGSRKIPEKGGCVTAEKQTVSQESMRMETQESDL
ncbi:MAG: hypothetical protein SOT28_00785 [Fusicatenibacter sp.]|nr:hypothetical protein [Lachnospiraceae bacterium]MDY2936842.1 hypothetical protein [Fusicatenibacter sp.]